MHLVLTNYNSYKRSFDVNVIEKIDNKLKEKNLLCKNYIVKDKNVFKYFRKSILCFQAWVNYIIKL